MSHYKDNNRDPSQKYYNILVKNNNTGYDKNGNPTPATDAVVLAFNETRTIPYIHHPREFYMSVVAFEMDTEAIPVFIADPVVGMEPTPDNVDPSLLQYETVYTITMEYFRQGVFPAPNVFETVQQRVRWFPEDLSATVPTGPAPEKYNMDPYFYSYTYQHFISVVNQSLQYCFNQLSVIANFPDDNYSTLFMTLENNYVTFYANNSLFLTNSEGVPTNGNQYIKLYFNTELYDLFSAFNSIKQAQPLSLQTSLGVYSDFYNTNYQILFSKNQSCKYVEERPLDLTVVPPGDPVLMCINKSEYSPLAYWNPIDRVLFMTAHLPVVPTLLSVGSNYYNSKPGYNADTQYIIADFAAQVSNGTEYKPNITYVSVSEYILNELYSDVPLYSIAINVFWRDLFGDLHPFALEAGGTALIKIMFRKKEFYYDEE